MINDDRLNEKFDVHDGILRRDYDLVQAHFKEHYVTKAELERRENAKLRWEVRILIGIVGFLAGGVIGFLLNALLQVNFGN